MKEYSEYNLKMVKVMFDLILSGKMKGKHREIAEYADSHSEEFTALVDEIFRNDSEKKSRVLELVDYLSPRLAEYIVAKGIVDDDSKIRISSIKATYRTRIESLNEKITVILMKREEEFEIRKWIIHILASSDPREYAKLIRRIVRDDTEDRQIRKEAIFALTNMDDELTIGSLCILLGDHDREIRQSGAWALSKIGSSSSINCLLAAIEDEDETVRDWAIRALRDMDDTRALQGLADVMKSAVPSEQVRLIRLLVERRSEIILRAIAEKLSSPDVNVRREAAWAMGVTLFTPAIPSLESLVNDEDEQVRDYAKKALMRMGQVDPTDFGFQL